MDTYRPAKVMILVACMIVLPGFIRDFAPLVPARQRSLHIYATAFCIVAAVSFTLGWRNETRLNKFLLSLFYGGTIAALILTCFVKGT